MGNLNLDNILKFFKKNSKRELQFIKNLLYFYESKKIEDFNYAVILNFKNKKY